MSPALPMSSIKPLGQAAAGCCSIPFRESPTPACSEDLSMHSSAAPVQDHPGVACVQIAKSAVSRNPRRCGQSPTPSVFATVTPALRSHQTTFRNFSSLLGCLNPWGRTASSYGFGLCGSGNGVSQREGGPSRPKVWGLGVSLKLLKPHGQVASIIFRDSIPLPGSAV